MPLNIGDVGKFVVKRQTDISYTLSPDDDDLTNYVFLHFNQTTRELQFGEIIDAFLYYDQKKRLCATMETPLITINKYGFVKVVNIMEQAGVFVNIGIAKDILLSKDFLPTNLKAWPKIDDEVPCILQVKTDQLIARMLTQSDVHNKPVVEVNTSVEGTVTKINMEGITICTNDFLFVYIHKSYLRKNYHLGERLTCKIINITKEGHYHGSTIENKEYSRLSDSDLILNYLKKMGGVLPLGNASTPQDISRYFKMSKSAFKRALGALYKARLITIEDFRTLLNENKTSQV